MSIDNRIAVVLLAYLLGTTFEVPLQLHVPVPPASMVHELHIKLPLESTFCELVKTTVDTYYVNGGAALATRLMEQSVIRLSAMEMLHSVSKLQHWIPRPAQ